MPVYSTGHTGISSQKICVGTIQANVLYLYRQKYTCTGIIYRQKTLVLNIAQKRLIFLFNLFLSILNRFWPIFYTRVGLPQIVFTPRGFLNARNLILWIMVACTGKNWLACTGNNPWLYRHFACILLPVFLPYRQKNQNRIARTTEGGRDKQNPLDILEICKYIFPYIYLRIYNVFWGLYLWRAR